MAHVPARADCPLCTQPGGVVLADAARWRIVRADEPGLPCFVRVIWREHVAEMTDLSEPARAELIAVVLAVEQAMRMHVAPDKINLASLGNAVPHLHWHVVGRWRGDTRFPGSPWTQPSREAAAGPGPSAQSLAAFERALGRLVAD